MRWTRAHAAAVALATAVAATGWWSSTRHRPPPNVLLVTIDTLRADRVGAYGYPAARTPTLDALAADGVLCEDAIASAPITMPSHATILTGLQPPAHGVRDNGTTALPSEMVTLAERLKTAGYDTRAFVSAVVLGRLYGLDQGFDAYDDDLWAEDAPRLFMIRDRPAVRTAGRFLEWFGSWRAAPARAPFFAWVHFFDPHQPLEAAAVDAAGAASPYDAEVTAADRGLGMIVEALRAADVLDDTLVIVTADHGESLGEHGEATHAVFVYDATLRVPFIVRYPARLPAGRRYAGAVRHVDVVPTVLGLLRLEAGPPTAGIDLTAAWRGDTPPPALSQYAESLLSELGFGMAPLHALRRDGFKWIRAPKAELYDLQRDPGELDNLYPRAARQAEGMDRELEAILSSARPIAPREAPLAQETLEMLQSLGYLAPDAERRSMGGVDPKDGIHIYNQLEEARHHAQQRRWAEAERSVRAILATLPGHVAARNVLGLALVRQRRYAEARQTYERSLADEPDQFRVHALLGSIALLENDLAAAEERFGRALAMNPKFVEAMLNLGLVASLRGDAAASEQWYDRAEANQPNVPATARRMGDLYYEQGRFREALVHYDRALALSPQLFPALVQAGNTARRLGELARAASSFERAAALRPDSWVPSYNLACLRAASGDVDGALAALETSVSRGLRDGELVAGDTDLDPLRSHPRFPTIVSTLTAR